MMRAFMTSGFTLWTRYCDPPFCSEMAHWYTDI
jgi:hypothetical protein